MFIVGCRHFKSKSIKILACISMLLGEGTGYESCPLVGKLKIEAIYGSQNRASFRALRDRNNVTVIRRVIPPPPFLPSRGRCWRK